MRIRWTPEAAQDLSITSNYIFTDSPEASRRVATAINNAAKSLKAFPFRGRLGSIAPTRELLVESYPYVLVYAVVEDTIVILNIYHSAQDRPSY